MTGCLKTDAHDGKCKDDKVVLVARCPDVLCSAPPQEGSDYNGNLRIVIEEVNNFFQPLGKFWINGSSIYYVTEPDQ